MVVFGSSVEEGNAAEVVGFNAVAELLEQRDKFASPVLRRLAESDVGLNKDGEKGMGSFGGGRLPHAAGHAARSGGDHLWTSGS